MKLYHQFVKKSSALVLVGCLLLTMTGCRSQTPSVPETPQQTALTKTAFALNTVVTISLYDHQDENILNEAIKLCDHYEALLSRTKESSEIYQLNETFDTPVALSDETMEVLTTGLKYSELSNGAFDLTLKPLTSLWNFGSDNQRLPAPTEISEALTHIGYQNLVIDNNNVTLKKEGMGVDLGAIAKGYIADKIKEFLIEQGVTSAIINLGGNVLCVGSKPDGSDFKVGIQRPFKDRNETIAVMELSDYSVVSSGIYERCFEEDGKLYHHILNPSTGYPYENDLLSVTIVSKKSIDGDALSTTAFALGLEKGMELVESLPDTYAVFITKDDQLHYSKGFLETFPVTLENNK